MNKTFDSALLDWYDRSARKLPWREEPLPYRVWISEIMLQQTRVDTVLPYFYRFLEALPDIPALAAAGEETLLKLWQGLGYYSRVRNLHRAAKILVEQHGGQLPSDPGILKSLPGIGEYTAAAIASIAFGIRVPSVDGNLLRVLSRLNANSEDITQPQAKKQLTAAAEQLMPQNRPGDFNQAMMDLGATICLPNGAPLCDACPVSAFCKAYGEDRVMEYPVKSPKKPRQIQERTVFVLCVADRVLLQKRPPKGLLADLWELPGTEGYLDPIQAKTLLESWGLALDTIQPIEEATHIFTHIEWHMRGYLAVLSPDSGTGGFYPVSRQVLEDEIMLPTAFRAYIKYLP